MRRSKLQPRVPSAKMTSLLKHLTETIEHLNAQIHQAEARIEMLANQRDVDIVSSIPGVGKRSAAAILAEIGDAKQFSNGKQIAS